MTRKFQPRLQRQQRRKFDWSCRNRRQVERVLWRLVPRWGREWKWTKILGERASTTLFRGCSCDPSDSKLQSHRSWWRPSRTVQTGGETALERMHSICVAMWETGEWPEEWTFSTFIPLPKKGDLKQCENYRTIALASHASKILRIILERIRVKTETEIADAQAGFRQGRGTRDQITNLRILMHKARERASATTIYVLRGLQEGVRLYLSW